MKCLSSHALVASGDLDAPVGPVKDRRKKCTGAEAATSWALAAVSIKLSNNPEDVTANYTCTSALSIDDMVVSCPSIRVPSTHHHQSHDSLTVYFKFSPCYLPLLGWIHAEEPAAEEYYHCTSICSRLHERRGHSGMR